MSISNKTMILWFKNVEKYTDIFYNIIVNIVRKPWWRGLNWPFFYERIHLFFSTLALLTLSWNTWLSVQSQFQTWRTFIALVSVSVSVRPCWLSSIFSLIFICLFFHQGTTVFTLFLTSSWPICPTVKVSCHHSFFGSFHSSSPHTFCVCDSPVNLPFHFCLTK